VSEPIPQHSDSIKSVDAHIKPMSEECGLEVVFSLREGCDPVESTSEIDLDAGITRRIDFEGDPLASLRAAIDEVARQAGLVFPKKARS